MRSTNSAAWAPGRPGRAAQRSAGVIKARIHTVQNASSARAGLRPEAKRGPEPLLQRHTIPHRKDPRRLIGCDLNASEKRLTEVFQPVGKVRQFVLTLYIEARGNTAGGRHADEIDPGLCMARLHAGFAVDAVIEHNDCEIGRAFRSYGRERAKPHQHFAITGYDSNPPAGLGHRKTQTDHSGAAHRPPEIESLIVVAGGRGIPGGRSETRNDQEVITPVGEQRCHGRTTLEHHFVHTFLPINCCDRITAAIRSSPKACWMARWVTLATSSGSRAR